MFTSLERVVGDQYGAIRVSTMTVADHREADRGGDPWLGV
jgi:hypothetical protein